MLAAHGPARCAAGCPALAHQQARAGSRSSSAAWHAWRIRAQPSNPAATVCAPPAAAPEQPPAAALASRRALLHTAAAGAALLLGAGSAQASSTATGAEQLAAAARGCVAAVSAIPVGGRTGVTPEVQLGSGIVWDGLGHVVTAYAPLTRVLRGSPSGEAQVGGPLVAARRLHSASSHQSAARHCGAVLACEAWRRAGRHVHAGCRAHLHPLALPSHKPSDLCGPHGGRRQPPAAAGHAGGARPPARAHRAAGGWQGGLERLVDVGL